MSQASDFQAKLLPNYLATEEIAVYFKRGCLALPCSLTTLSLLLLLLPSSPLSFHSLTLSFSLAFLLSLLPSLFPLPFYNKALKP